MAAGLNKIRLSTNPTDAAIAALQIGDIVYLDGTIYTAREGVYMRVIEDGVDLPLDLPAVSAANFNCSPAATQHEDGSFTLGAVLVLQRAPLLLGCDFERLREGRER